MLKYCKTNSFLRSFTRNAIPLILNGTCLIYFFPPSLHQKTKTNRSNHHLLIRSPTRNLFKDFQRSFVRSLLWGQLPTGFFSSSQPCVTKGTESLILHPPSIFCTINKHLTQENGSRHRLSLLLLRTAFSVRKNYIIHFSAVFCCSLKTAEW